MDPMEQMQDPDLVKRLISNQSELETKRLPHEQIWREIDNRIDPKSGDLWNGGTASPRVYGAQLMDRTGIRGLRRFQAAIAGITIPRHQRYVDVVFADKDLMKLDPVKRWCGHASERLYDCRYAPLAGFEGQAFEDIRSLGKYGPAPMWIGEKPGQGLFYKTLHLSEIWFQENYCGQVDTVHRRYRMTLRNAIDEFGGIDRLTPKMRECAERDKLGEEFEFLHVTRPNPGRMPGKFGRLGMSFEGVHIAIDEKWIIRRGGYRTKPLIVSRNGSNARDEYGDSVALDALPSMRTVNEMARTIMRSAHKAVDPALNYYDDGDISKVVTKPGGLNPGLVDEFGRSLIHPMPGGGDIPLGMEMLEAEREGIRDTFLEDFFRLLSNPSDRMTATQVLEQIQKEGILVAPFAARYETEKEAPRVERELDLLMSAGQIDDLPPEVLEAGVRPRAVMDNPLARMSRAEHAAGFTRLLELGTQAASFDPNIGDIIDVEEGMRDAAAVLGVRPNVIRSPEAVAELRKGREDEKAGAELAATAPDLAGAALDLARANEIAAAA